MRSKELSCLSKNRIALSLALATAFSGLGLSGSVFRPLRQGAPCPLLLTTLQPQEISTASPTVPGAVMPVT